MKTNNTKGAIEFCEDLKEVDFTYCKKSYDLNKYINNIIELLQRGEKFEVMWKKFRKKYGEEYIIFEGGNSVKDTMDEFEQKYFPI